MRNLKIIKTPKVASGILRGWIGIEIIFSILVLFSICGELYCAVPCGIIYQGTIRKDSAIYTGQIDAVFRITNQDGSIEYWTSGSTTVYVNGG
ncbi:MAG: dissimilatory sulfite reductase D family protein, partial [Elusimicrobia bacterium]|nr:dissimilatory sulfite reductase D family protein [Elusimicrobiota bacterium]